MYIPVISDFFESLFSDSDEYENRQQNKLIDEILELTNNGEDVNMVSKGDQ